MIKWLRMEDLKQKKINKSSWIPLKKIETVLERGENGCLGHQKEIEYILSVAIHKNKKEKALEYDWCSLSGFIHKGRVEGKKYLPSDIFIDDDGEELGIFLLLDQEVIREDFRKWFLHQDFILTLDLEKEGDVWVSPSYGYEEVVKIKRDNQKKIVLLEVKAEYLKDYLEARNMELYVLSYCERMHVTENPIVKDDNDNDKNAKWELYSIEILEGGGFTSEVFVEEVWRTDVSEYDEIPDLSSSPSDENLESKSYTIRPREEKKKLCETISRLWKKEWIESSTSSPKVREDEEQEKVFFKIDETGKEVSKNELKRCGKWLWFDPNVINHILEVRNTKLIFKTRETGIIECAYGHNVCFGVNNLGKINIFSEDMVMLPTWIQKKFSGFNITPEGGISKELYQIEINMEEVGSSPLEENFKYLYFSLNNLFNKKYNINLFNKHEDIQKLIRNIHRFKAYNGEGVFKLAKEISRIIVETINLKEIKKILNNSDKEIKSIKAIQKILETLVDEKKAKETLTSLVAIYELRHGDAHLPGNNILEAFNLINIDEEMLPIKKGETLIFLCCKMMEEIKQIIKDSLI